MTVNRYTDLRAWQHADAFETAILKLCAEGTLSRDLHLRGQLEGAASGPPAHLAEGFGRFSPPDFARFATMARASLIESQQHLRAAMKKGHITEAVRREHDECAEAAIRNVTALIAYLQSAEAMKKARTIRDATELKQERRKRREP